MIDYWRKKLEELNGNNNNSSNNNSSSNNSSSNTTKSSYSSDYWQNKMNALDEENRKKSTRTLAERIEESDNILDLIGRPVEDDEEEEERKWYDGFVHTPEAFSDGDITGMDILKMSVASLADSATNLIGGVVGWGEDTVDAGATLLAKGAEIIGMQDTAKKLRTFAEGELYDEKEIARQIVEKGGLEPGPFGMFSAAAFLDNVLNTKKVDNGFGGTMTVKVDNSVYGDESDSLISAAGETAAKLGLTVAAGGFPVADIITGVTVFGEQSEQALRERDPDGQEAATLSQAIGSGLVSAGAEIIFEKISGGIKFGGQTLDDGLTKLISSKISNVTLKNLVHYVTDIGGESLEEIFTEVVSKLGTKLYKEEDLSEILFSEEALNDYIRAGLSGGLLGGFFSGGKTINSTAQGRDSKSGLTENEQKVFDKVYEGRIAETEKNGKKLTTREKNKIYDEVLEDLKKGGISTDTIESVLGGDAYTMYKSTTDKVDALRKEIDELENMPAYKFTVKQQNRLDKAKTELARIERAKTASAQKAQLSESVQKQLTRQTKFGTQADNYLIESYNEQGRRGQAFQADPKQYKNEYARQTVQNALDFNQRNKNGIHNGREAHDFIDLCVKIAEDKGKVVDFTTTAEMAQSIKNGNPDNLKADPNLIEAYNSESGNKLVINMDVNRSLTSLVGHEITDMMRGAEAYSDLQKAAFSYAETKGELETRRSSVKNRYKTVNADLDGELTSDLVGDYLFTDSGFIQHLSTNHRNVFQKIYDEIKYLYKLATAGSKEARQLEKLKHEFEKVWRDNAKSGSKASADTQFSVLKDVNGEAFVDVAEDIFDENNGESVARTIQRVIHERFNNLIDVHGQKIQINKTTNDEFRKSNSANDLLENAPQTYNDKLKTIANADEILSAAKNWIGEEIKHTRADDIVEFARGNVMYRVGKNGYVADVIVGTRKNGSAVLYDLVNIYSKKIAEAPVTMASDNNSQRRQETSADVIIPQNPKMSRGNGKNPKYSLSDSDGKQLTKEQSEYFKDSKMRDDNGNLKVMYHGSQDAGFHEFDADFSDDDRSFFFVDRNDVAATYSGTSETYAAPTFHTAEDFNRFFAEYGMDEYSVKEEMHGEYKWFVLYEDGTEIASSETAKMLYDEFRDWTGLGEGEANYKVYLNLTNPLEIDAKGRPWNKIDAEFSQEVYDKYKSLTAEEKAALTDLAEWEDFRVFNSEIQEARDNDLASAYAKMGEDVNIYDLFSVAADNFSEDSMRENARNYLKTRDYAQRAKEQGYDGVIFKNLVDNGGYSNGSEGASTVAIAFDSNQIKSVANEKPTGDPDIRYSLSEDSQGRELSAEQKEYFKDSKIVDDKGNLLVMYHGTKKGGFTVFENKNRKSTEGFYFTNDKEYSNIFEGIKPETGKYYDVVQEGIDKGYFSPETYEVYLDVKNPLVLTADNQDIIEDIGYWENIYTPIKNAGYDGVMLEDMSQVFVFNSNQIKRVDNTKPTSDPDIRYSLSEYTAEEKKAHNKAVLEHFGKTYSWAETGYLLLDGTRLDLSGKHDGAPGGYRTVDHRDITEALGYDYGGGDYSGSLVQFMSEGNIRIIPECNGINLSVKPTQEQEQALSSYISRYRGEVLLDIDDLNGNTVISVEYPYGTYYTKVLNDIREWFDNGKKPENSGSYSLTKEGETPKAYGNFNIYSKDIRLAPTQEEVAPLNETTSPDMEQVEDVAPTPEDMAEIFPSGPNLYDLERELQGLEEQLAEAADANDIDTVNSLLPRYDELLKNVHKMRAEEAAENRDRIASLEDADAPPEVEAPYYEDEAVTVDDPFEKRDIKEVGNRKVKAYMYENPEVKPFFQKEANVMLGELSRTTKGERWFNGSLIYESSYDVAQDIPWFSGTKRHTSNDLAYLLDECNYTYAEIEKGLQAIIEDDGAENNACSKRIEFLLNDRLLNGYQDMDHGFDIPPDQDYINLLNEKQINEYNEEAFKSYLAAADNFAPMAESTQSAPAEDIAPTFDTRKRGEIKGQQTAFAEEVDEDEPKIAKILTEEPETSKKKRSIIIRALTNFADKGIVFENLAKKTNNRELEAKYNFLHYSESRAQEYIADNLKPIVDKVTKAGTTAELYNYVYHLHNIDRMSLETEENRTKRETLREQFKGYTDKQINDIAMEWIKRDTPEDVKDRIKVAREYVDTLKGKNKPVFDDSVTADTSREIVKQLEAKHPEFRELSEAIVEYNTKLRNMLVKGNVISQETADLWAKMYPHYVPIRRVGKDGAAVNVPLDTNKTGINAPIKRATGGNSDILPLFDTMALRTEQTFKAIAKNSFGTELMHTLDSVVENEATSLDEVMDNFDNHEELLQKGKNGKSPTFTVFEDGKRVTFEITEDMYDALKPTSEGLSYTNKVANTVNNIFRGLLTEYNPVFMVTNAVKDVQDVLINSQHATSTYLHIPVALKELTTKGRWYTEYMKNGGSQNTYFDGESKTFKEENKGFVKAIGMPLRAISEANNFIERVPRLAEYIASRESGASIETAMLDAARVTTNFAAGGDITKWANRNGVTFLNASVQGAMQQVRNVREAKAEGLKGWMKLAAKTTLAGVSALLLNHLLWDDDEEYEELSDYVKQNYYIVAKFGDGKFVRIPKGRTVAVIQEAFNQMDNLITGNDEADLKAFLDLAISNLAPNNPLDNNILAPIIQAANNKTWYGEDLVPTRLQDLPAAEQYDESTDALSKWLGEKLNVSPYKLNYLLNQYSGGVGDVVLPMITPEAESGDNSFLGNMLAPFKDKFTTDSVMNNQNVSDFYDTMDELAKNAKSMNATDRDVLKYKYLNSVNTDLSKLYAQKREIQNSNLADDEKYEAVREIQRQIDELARESLNTYNSVYINNGYAVVGDRYYKLNDTGEWQKLSDDQYEKQEEVTNGLGIDPSTYWRNKSEYDFAYEYPEKYAVAKSVGGYEKYKQYASELYDIKADKDEYGKSISGSRKEKVIDYINNLDADYGEKIILFKSEYNADDTYNYEIIDYLNSREDISYTEMETILKELGFTVDSKGNIYWD